METIFAQVVADPWQVDPEDVVLTSADTAAIAIGFGTMASRSTVTASAAIHYASGRLRDKVFAIAAHLLECAPADLELRPRAGSASSACRARGDACSRWHRRPGPAGTHAARTVSKRGSRKPSTGEPQTVTWSYAAHAAIIEVDRETGRVAIDNYAVAHDCGIVVNPMLVEGQSWAAPCRVWAAPLRGIVYDAKGNCCPAR